MEGIMRRYQRGKLQSYSSYEEEERQENWPMKRNYIRRDWKKEVCNREIKAEKKNEERPANYEEKGETSRENRGGVTVSEMYGMCDSTYISTISVATTETNRRVKMS
jgi:hypothetical protein